MGRKQEGLEVKIPSVFRCPISLEVMRSPVSLCTGITYDRVSIQRWLDSGNTTCPATMLPLPSTDLVPNLTLERLIHLWSSSDSAVTAGRPDAGARRRPEDVLRELRPFADGSAAAAGGSDPVNLLREFADFFSSPDVDEFEKNNVVGSGGCARFLTSLLRRKDSDLDVLEVSVRVFVIILTTDAVEKGNKKAAVACLAGDCLDGTVAALVRVLKGADSLAPRIDAAMLMESLITASDADAKTAIAEADGVIPELIRLTGPSDEKGAAPDRRAVEVGLGCLDGISSAAAKRVRPTMVSAGVVPAVTRVLKGDTTAKVAARALRVMEAAAWCAEGRAEICEGGPAAVGAVVGKMMKAGRDGAEAAVAVLWAVCHRFRDRRAVDAATGAEGAATKLLLLMQSGCSPAARGMAADLLKIFRVNAKGCLAGYDTKTTHIMPF